MRGVKSIYLNCLSTYFAGTTHPFPSLIQYWFLVTRGLASRKSRDTVTPSRTALELPQCAGVPVHNFYASCIVGLSFLQRLNYLRTLTLIQHLRNLTHHSLVCAPGCEVDLLRGTRSLAPRSSCAIPRPSQCRGLRKSSHRPDARSCLHDVGE